LKTLSPGLGDGRGCVRRLIQGVTFGAAGTAGKFQRNLVKADSQQGELHLLPASMRQLSVENVANAA
jgi:hypothetical protein